MRNVAYHREMRNVAYHNLSILDLNQFHIQTDKMSGGGECSNRYTVVKTLCFLPNGESCASCKYMLKLLT